MNNTQNPEVIIYGGSFNPPTNAHKGIIETCRQQKPDADIWLMPSGVRKDKSHGISDQHRLGMLRALHSSLNDPEGISVCTMEIEDQGMTETYKSVGRLALMRPDKSFRYIYGSDAYESMPGWEQGSRLQAELPMIILPREGAIVPEADNIEIVEFNMSNSSTEIRERAAEGLEIDHLTPVEVANYIKANNLYKQLITVA